MFRLGGDLQSICTFAAIEGTNAHRSALRQSVLLALISYFGMRIGSTWTDWYARCISRREYNE